MSARHLAAVQPVGYIASLETRNFSFEAHGATEEEANEAMGRLLKRHGEQYGLRADWSDGYDDAFRTRQFEPGAGFRDDAKVIGS